jgi:histone deacetylase 1/2
LPSSGGFKYYVSFIDDYSRYSWIYLIKHKSDVESIFYTFQSHVERLLNAKIRTVQSDWGGEYHRLHAYFARTGIAHRVSCPHTSQQNGIAERKHRHLVETGLALLAHSSMPLRYWDEAFLTACYLINRMPTPIINNATPVFRLLNTPPEYSFLCTFGCACWPSLRKYNSRKLEFRSKMCVFLGYSPMHKGYKCLDRSTGRIYISRDVVFDEKVFPFSTPGAVVDVSKLLHVSFPSTEPVTQSTDTRSYDITMLPANALVPVDSFPVQVSSMQPDQRIDVHASGPAPSHAEAPCGSGSVAPSGPAHACSPVR